MRGYVALLVLAIGLGLVVAACGSGGGSADRDAESGSTGTPRSERTGRQATIMQQQAADVEVGETELGEIDFGHRKGLPFLRNVVGDPDAPVVIVEYSDFQ